MKYVIYILIILCGFLPLFLHRTWWIRPASLIVLGVISVFYMMALQTSARLATAREYQETKRNPSEEWMDATYKTRRIIEGYHPIGILLFAALMALAGRPEKKK
ncbi:MAG: hypothetical protein EAZ65_05980 [Verrucomicrobia bacterium]|nr:MAG: hypothetical protein EAZ84_06780 [Verrucomicrobiota bacterium]TAE87728.1 MAG: hypothetical protein EAZ82_07155 [Verrucomicrobiota bacterium]TAF25339.1 MAG: hypothetical protein EAZ71_07590 [Verrucomicrobiota bacterium]TAF41126.1 MAG: hypothetical protein EAZ65_05980 [Verrucomicrobiota bacterium]